MGSSLILLYVQFVIPLIQIGGIISVRCFKGKAKNVDKCKEKVILLHFNNLFLD